MVDYCVVCGDATPEDSHGHYIEMSNEEFDVYTEVWICDDCADSVR